MARVSESIVLTEANSTKKETRVTPTIILCTVLLVLGSTASSMSFKSQSKLYGFKHGVFQVFLMFIGEYFNLIIFSVLMSSDNRRFNHFLVLTNEARASNQEIHFTKLWMATTCLLDTIGSTLSLISLLLLPPSL